MVRPDELEVEAARRRMFEAAERAEARLKRVPWERVLLAAFAAGVLFGRVPAARSLLRGGLLWLSRSRTLKP